MESEIMWRRKGSQRTKNIGISSQDKLRRHHLYKNIISNPKQEGDCKQEIIEKMVTAHGSMKRKQLKQSARKTNEARREV